jgi:1-acyl-sn-glycerol-3-phosphate acyltransferase
MHPVYYAGWTAYRLFFKVYCRWSVYNADRVPATGAVILASNHASFLDPPLVGSALKRDINYLARENLFEWPVANWILQRCNAVPVDREGGGAKGLRMILDRLNKGAGIILFPEGTRTRDGKLQPARSGIGLTVIKTTAPVVPVRVFGTYDAFGRHLKFPRSKKVSVKFDRPLDFRELRNEASVCPKPRLRQIYQQVADEIMVAIAKLGPYEDKETFP